MFDIIDIDFTLESYISCQIAYFAIILLFWNRCVRKFNLKNKGGYLIIFVILFCVFGFENGDFYGYQSYLKEKNTEHMEPIYGFIAELVSYNYFLFRLIVWGGAVILFYKTSKRFNLDPNKALFILFVMFISTFDYARASLAMSIYYYGLSFLCVPIKNNKYISYLFGFFIIILSFYFHNSMLVCIVLSPIALIKLDVKKNLIFLLAFLFLSPSFKNLFFLTFGGTLFSNFAINDKLLTYANLESGYTSSYEWIRRCLEYLFYFVPILMFIKFLYFDKKVSVASRYERLFYVSLFIILFSVGIILIDMNFFVFFYRYLYMLMIPIAILICYARFDNIISQRQLILLIYSCMLYKLFVFFKILLGNSVFLV